MVRIARLCDVAELAAVHVAAWRGGGNAALPPTMDQRLALWNHVLGGGPRRTQVWVSLGPDGRIRGFIAAGGARVLKERFDGELTAIYIAPEFQRQGLGRELLHHAIAELRRNRVQSMMAWVTEGSDGAKWMAKLGARTQRESRQLGAMSPEFAMGWERLTEFILRADPA